MPSPKIVRSRKYYHFHERLLRSSTEIKDGKASPITLTLRTHHPNIPQQHREEFNVTCYVSDTALDVKDLSGQIVDKFQLCQGEADDIEMHLDAPKGYLDRWVQVLKKQGGAG